MDRDTGLKPRALWVQAGVLGDLSSRQKRLLAALPVSWRRAMDTRWTQELQSVLSPDMPDVPARPIAAEEWDDCQDVLLIFDEKRLPGGGEAKG